MRLVVVDDGFWPEKLLFGERVVQFVFPNRKVGTDHDCAATSEISVVSEKTK